MPQKKQISFCHLHKSGQSIRARWSSFHAGISYLLGHIWEDHHMDREHFTQHKDKSKDSRNHPRHPWSHHWMSSGVNNIPHHLQRSRHPTLPPSVDILGLCDGLVLISRESSPADKLQKALNTVEKAANMLGLYFSPAITKTMPFNTTRQPNFKFGLQHLEMVNDYRYLGVAIDRRLSFIQHVAETKCKVNSRFNMIKAITNLKVGVNTKKLILGLPNETISTMIYKESGILPLRLLANKETSTYLLRAATKPIQTDIIQLSKKKHKKIPEPSTMHHGQSRLPGFIKKSGYIQSSPNVQRTCSMVEPPI